MEPASHVAPQLQRRHRLQTTHRTPQPSVAAPVATCLWRVPFLGAPAPDGVVAPPYPAALPHHSSPAGRSPSPLFLFLLGLLRGPRPTCRPRNCRHTSRILLGSGVMGMRQPVSWQSPRVIAACTPPFPRQLLYLPPSPPMATAPAAADASTKRADVCCNSSVTCGERWTHNYIVGDLGSRRRRTSKAPCGTAGCGSAQDVRRGGIGSVEEDSGTLRTSVGFRHGPQEVRTTHVATPHTGGIASCPAVPASSCPWLEPMGERNTVQCMNGSIVRGQDANSVWWRCPSGRARCPSNKPVMCANDNDRANVGRC
eukprot:gene57368-biopygen119210